MSATDVITLEEAKRYLGMEQSDTAKDAELATYIAGVSTALDAFSGPVVQREVEDELHDGGGAYIFLSQYPVLSMATVHDFSGTTDTTLTEEVLGAAAESNSYSLDYANGILYRRRGGYDYPFTGGRRNVTVSYVAGRFEDTNAVSEPYKLAACLSLADAWRSTIGGGNVSYGEYEGGDKRVTYAIPYQAQAYVERRAPRVA